MFLMGFAVPLEDTVYAMFMFGLCDVKKRKIVCTDSE